jgi:hypothetical protein
MKSVTTLSRCAPVEVVRNPYRVRPAVILPYFGNSRNVEITVLRFFRFAQMAASDGGNSFSRESQFFPHPAKVISGLSSAALALGATLEILEQRD